MTEPIGRAGRFAQDLVRLWAGRARLGARVPSTYPVDVGPLPLVQRAAEDEEVPAAAEGAGTA
ncbi:MAG: hypothetical protein QME94_02910, partial [Anaerolineae bacterium]|nr:hypothetical protein [Anaerolineae bacterium]